MIVRIGVATSRAQVMKSEVTTSSKESMYSGRLVVDKLSRKIYNLLLCSTGNLHKDVKTK